MRAVVQRVTHAAVRVGDETVGAIERGFLVLVGVGVDDDERDADALAQKIAGLRIFSDDQDAMNLALADVGGAVLVVSQFTLHGDVRKGRRPSFITAARGEPAEVQKAVADSGGSQCGYCTPGFVMSLFAEQYRPGRTGPCRTGSWRTCRCAPNFSPSESGSSNAAHFRWAIRISRLSGLMKACSGERSKK